MYEHSCSDRCTLIRAWHGWTTPDNADVYETLLQRQVFPGIAAKGVRGYRGIQLLRRDGDEEVEFVTLMTFGSWEAVRAFAGPDVTAAVVPDEARALLARYARRSFHYELRAAIPAASTT